MGLRGGGDVGGFYDGNQIDGMSTRKSLVWLCMRENSPKQPNERFQRLSHGIP